MPQNKFRDAMTGMCEYPDAYAVAPAELIELALHVAHLWRGDRFPTATLDETLRLAAEIERDLPFPLHHEADTRSDASFAWATWGEYESDARAEVVEGYGKVWERIKAHSEGPPRLETAIDRLLSEPESVSTPSGLQAVLHCLVALTRAREFRDVLEEVRGSHGLTGGGMHFYWVLMDEAPERTPRGGWKYEGWDDATKFIGALIERIDEELAAQRDREDH